MNNKGSKYKILWLEWNLFLLKQLNLALNVYEILKLVWKYCIISNSRKWILYHTIILRLSNMYLQENGSHMESILENFSIYNKNNDLQ